MEYGYHKKTQPKNEVGFGDIPYQLIHLQILEIFANELCIIA
jgi:hypothetical protein